MLFENGKMSKKLNYTFTLLFFALLSNSLLAQQNEFGNWLMYFGTNRLTDEWSIHSEVQYRNHTIEPVNIEQLLLRTGLNYHLSKNAVLTGGYVYIASHVYESEQKKPESREHRLFQQLILINKVSRLKFEHRYRLEQRWIDSGDNTTYKNRIRYRLMVFLPLNKPVIEPGTLFLGVYDEVFMNTKDVFFDRNRLYAALGYQFTKNLQAQVGYLYQRVNDFGKSYLQAAVVFNTDFRKEE